MWICSHCGHKNMPSGKYCAACGAERVVAKPVSKKPRGREKARILYVLCAACFFCAILCFGTYFFGDKILPFASTEDAFAEVGEEVTPEPPRQLNERPEESGEAEETEDEDVPNKEEPIVPEESVNNNFPAFSLTALDGRVIDESYFTENRLTMVNFWATWCGPCIGEIPDLQKLETKYANQGFAVLGVLLDADEADEAKSFLSENDITYPTIICEGPFADISADFEAIPQSLFIDQDGNIVGEVFEGAMNLTNWCSEVEERFMMLGD